MVCQLQWPQREPRQAIPPRSASLDFLQIMLGSTWCRKPCDVETKGLIIYGGLGHSRAPDVRVSQWMQVQLHIYTILLKREMH